MKQFSILFFCMFFSHLFGQDTLIYKEPYNQLNKYKTRKEIQVIVNTSSGDDINRWDVWAGFGFVSEGLICFGGASYYIPKWHLFNLKLGTGIHYDGVMPLVNWEKDYDLKTPIGDSLDISIKFVADVPAKERFAFGLHYGIGDNEILVGGRDEARHIKAGFTILRAKSADLLLSSKFKKRKGSRLVTINFDGVKYFHNPRPYIFNSQQTEEEYLSRIEESKIDFGISVNLEAYASIWSEMGTFGFKWIFGLGVPPYRKMPWVQLGAGLSFSF